MQVELVSLQQRLDLRSGEMYLSISLRLPDGKEIELPLDQDASLLVIRAMRGSEEVPRAVESEPMPPPPVMVPAPEMTNMPRPNYGDDVQEFVGGDDADSAAVFGGTPAPAPMPPPPPIPQPQIRQPSRQVSMNDFGYPIVQRNGVDPGEITGSGDNADEDGVSSI